MALFDILALQVRDYVGLCGTGSAEERGTARTKLERKLPGDGFLERLLAPTNGRVLSVEDVIEVFPSN